MGDNNNELVVVELIRREMKSITDTFIAAFKQGCGGEAKR